LYTKFSFFKVNKKSLEVKWVRYIDRQVNVDIFLSKLMIDIIHTYA